MSLSVTNWGKIHLLEARLKWHRSKYNYRVAKVKKWRDAERTAHDWHNQKALARAREMVGKWERMVGPEATEIHALEAAIAKLKPKPPPLTKIQEKEKWLLANHPETHDGVRKIVAIILARYPDLYITSTYRPNAGYHGLGRAIDIAYADYSRMDPVGSWIESNLGPHLTEGIHNPTLSRKNGMKVPASFWGSETWAEHRNHIHVAV